MDIEFSKKLLVILIENSARILAGGFGVNHAEGAFFEVIRHLRSDTRLRDYFLRKVRSTLEMPNPGALDGEVIPAELIELAAHELRWPEFLELAKDRIGLHFGGDAGLAIGDVATHIRNAYSDDWDDREFYSHYQP